jgi:hypothetical protein
MSSVKRIGKKVSQLLSYFDAIGCGSVLVMEQAKNELFTKHEEGAVTTFYNLSITLI